MTRLNKYLEREVYKVENNYKKYKELIYVEETLIRLMKDVESADARLALANAIYEIHGKEIELREKINED